MDKSELAKAVQNTHEQSKMEKSLYPLVVTGSKIAMSCKVGVGGMFKDRVN